MLKEQFLSEGFKPNQLLEEDWEELVKELTQAYIDGKVTEKQISNKLSRAGMGMLAKKRAHDIALANENKRNIKKRANNNENFGQLTREQFELMKKIREETITRTERYSELVSSNKSTDEFN